SSPTLHDALPIFGAGSQAVRTEAESPWQMDGQRPLQCLLTCYNRFCTHAEAPTLPCTHCSCSWPQSRAGGFQPILIKGAAVVRPASMPGWPNAHTMRCDKLAQGGSVLTPRRQLPPTPSVTAGVSV